MDVGNRFPFNQLSLTLCHSTNRHKFGSRRCGRPSEFNYLILNVYDYFVIMTLISAIFSSGRVQPVAQNSVMPSSSSQSAPNGSTSWMTSVLDLPPPSVEKPVPSVGSSRGPEPSPINPSSVYSMHRTPRTPGMADLQSPASNASSCIRLERLFMTKMMF